MPKNLYDLIADKVISEVAMPNTSFGGAGITSTPGSGNSVTRPNVDTGKTMEMWTPGDPFTDDYYFGGSYIPDGGVLD